MIEMFLGLVIFSVMVFPLMMIPMAAMDQSEEAKNTGLSNYEVTNLMGRFSKDINMATRFLPLKPIKDSRPTGSQKSFDESKQLFVAYWDGMQEKRVGYLLRPILPATGKWELVRAELEPGESIEDYETSDSKWRSLVQVLQGGKFYMQSPAGTYRPAFVYCQGPICGTGIQAKNADGVTLQSITTSGAVTPSSTGILFIYRNAQTKVPAMYFRLAALQNTANTAYNKTQIMPVATVVNAWDKQSTWMVEKIEQGDGAGGLHSLPVTTPQEVANNNNIPLPMNDIYYNNHTGNILAVSNSAMPANPVDRPQRGFYIFRFSPGTSDYRAFRYSVTGGSSYADHFPAVFHAEDKTVYEHTDMAGNKFVLNRFLSVTQDLQENIYVLAEIIQDSNNSPAGYWVEKFNAQGNFVSKFHLGADVTQAYGITTTASDEVLVLLKKSPGEFVLRAYPAMQNAPDPDRVAWSVESSNLADTGTMTPVEGFDWEAVKGLDYDMLHHRFLFVSAPSGQPVQILNLDADFLSNNDEANDEARGHPKDRARLMKRIYNPSLPGTYTVEPVLGNASENIQGIAYDPLRNQVFLSAGTGRYYQVVPNARLNLVQQR